MLIPTNMAQPTQDALSALEDEVGDIDEFAREELGYTTTDDLHGALMGLQVDSVATAIYQIKKGKAVVIADQTGIGKGRQAAAIIRWSVKQGHTPVFISVKPSLFTDMYGDLADIGTDDVQPFVLNSDAWVAGADGNKLFANKPALHKRRLQAIEATGQLPDGANAVFMTYSQISKDNLQRRVLMTLAPNAVFILDESHNAAGDSSTGEFVIGALELAKGVTYLSATYAKRPDNMPLYFKTDIGNAAADTDGLALAMAAGGLPLQTVVSNNLVKAGQMFRRERSYDGVQISSVFDTGNRELHEKLSNEATKALRALVSADKAFHSGYVKALRIELAAQGASARDNAGNQAKIGLQHTEFSSVVHNFVKQMLLGLKAQSAADAAIASLKRGEKPIIAVENTMGSFLVEYADINNIAQGGGLGAFDYRTVLSRALERSRVITIKDAKGKETKRNVPLSDLDTLTRQAYQNSQAVIDGLKLSIPVSPIDWMRAQIIKAGYSVAEITGRTLSVDYSNPAKPILSAIDQLEKRDKVNTTRQFNSGKLDALILNVAGSTGISLHASEKFSDQRQRHMIVAQAASDINTFMQMLGRIHRTGQVALPKYTILSVDLPTEKRPTAVLSIKMKSLNANTSSNTESATSVKTSDILNKYGDQIVTQYLSDNYALAVALDVQDLISGEDAQDDIARKATGRLALQPIEVQHAFYDEVEGQYNALIEYLNKTNQNDLEPRTFDFDAKETRQEVLFEGPDKSTPFGEDAIYGEYSIKAQGIAMKPEEIREAIKTALDGKESAAHVNDLVTDLLTTWTAQVNANRTKHGLATGAFDAEKYGAFIAGLYGKDAVDDWVDQATKQIASGKDVQDITADAMASTHGTREGMEFMREHAIGKTFRIDINSEPYNAIITNIRSTHKSTGSPFSLSKVQLTVSVNGALRSLSIPGTQFKKIVVSDIQGGYRIEQLFKEQPANQRETAKIITGNLLAAYGEIAGARGTIISFTKQDGTTEQGILLPKLFDYSKNTRGDYRLSDGAAALRFLQKSDNKDIGRIGIMSRDGNVRVLPSGQGIRVQVPKSKAKGGKFFLDKALIEAGGDFVSSGNYMVSTVYDRLPAESVLDLLMKKQALYTLPSMAEEAKAMAGDAAFSRGKSDVLSKNGKFKGWPKFNTWTRQEYSDVVSLLPEAYRGDSHRSEPVATKDWDALAAAVLPELEALNTLNGAGTFRLDDLGNILVDERKSERDAVVNDALPIAKKHGLGIFITGVRTESIAHYRNAGFVSELGLGAVLARETGSKVPVMPMMSGLVNNTTYGTMMSYKPRGFPMPMFARAGDTTTNGLPAPQVTSIVDAIRARWGNAPEIIVVASMADPLIPQKVRDHDQMQKSQGATGEPEGFIYKGKVYIVASELVTPSDVMRVLFHESLGHAGLRGVFGDKLKPILQQLAALRRTEVAAKAKQYGLDMNTEAGRLEAAEEVLAEMAQSRPEMGYVKRAIGLIRGWLRANVPGFSSMKLTDADIVAQFILPARRFIEGKGGMKAHASGNIATQPGFSREIDALDIPEKQFNDTAKQAGGVDAYSKSRDSGKTVLTYKQWVQVRTPNFKKWWGYDWEANKTGIDAGVGSTQSAGENSGSDVGMARKSTGGLAIPRQQPGEGSILPVGRKANGDSQTNAIRNDQRGSGFIDEQTGEPRIFFHGTKDSFTKFDSEHLNKKDHGWLGRGNYVSSDHWISEDYSRRSRGAGKPLVMELFVRPNNPKVFTLRAKTIMARQSVGTIRQLTKEWISQGHNGALLDYGDGNVEIAVFESNGLKSATDNTGAFSEDGDINFSRSLGDTLSHAANNVRGVKLAAGYQVGDLINAAPGKLNWWHRTVGTQYNLAQRSKPFKRVFDSVQNFIGDVSYFASEAADLAPNILPKLESLKDIAKSPLSADDNKAISAPIFEGTLTWTRDASGKPIKAGENDTAGVVWTDAELKSLFKLTAPQIGLYREFRAATDKSLTNLAIADMLRFAGKDVDAIRDVVLDAKTPKEAADTLAEYLRSLAAMDEERSAVLMDTADKVVSKADKAQDLIKRGYAPLSRFGKYTLDVVDENGERVYFGMFENRFAAAKMNRQMQISFPGATINQGTVSDQAYKLFAGVTPETLELFGDMLGLESTGDGAANEAFQTYLKLAKSSRSAMKRLIQRKGIAGFNEDAGRVLAGFVYSNARQTSSSLHMGEMTQAATDKAAFKNQGELQDAAAKLVDYIKNPQEEAQAFRGVLFAQYIGGSIASAMVNITQPLTMTLPWLSQFGGITSAAKQMAAAVKDANKALTGNAKLDAALKRAEEDGTVSPQEVHQLMQQAQGRGALQSGDGTTAGNALAMANNGLSRVMLAWGKPFAWAEQFNRRSTFIAAYRTAVAQGMADPDAFARRAIGETQGIYNKGNKPVWARGAAGSILFTFKQYSISYVEMLQRMSKSGPEGKKAALLALGILFLMSGAGGMPGADDLDDIISGAMQAMGYNFDSRSKRQAFFVELLGQGGAQFVEHGISGLPGAPIDVSGRMGMGNLIPGTGLLTKKVDHTSDMAELAGPGGDLVKRGFEASAKLLKGEVFGANGAMATIAPKAAQNMAKAFDMANMGMYRDAKGAKVLDTDMMDAVMKGIGFQPTDVKKVQDASFEVQRMIGLNKLTESELAARWALGLFEKDSDKVKAAREDLAEWNRANPESPIRIKFTQVLQRVKKMNETKETRMIKTAPKEIRNAVRAELEASR